MPILDNQKHEDFCQHRIAGKSRDEAYRLAGFKPNRQHASRLATKGYIKDRIKELQAPLAEAFEITAESIAAELDAAAVFARECKQPGALVAAIVAKGKLAGLFVEKSTVNVTHNYQMMTIEEIRFEIAAIHAEARALKAGVQH